MTATAALCDIALHHRTPIYACWTARRALHLSVATLDRGLASPPFFSHPIGTRAVSISLFQLQWTLRLAGQAAKMMQAPVTVLQANTKRDTGKKAQYGNIMAGKVRRALCRAACRCRRQPPRVKRLLTAASVSHQGSAVLAASCDFIV